MFSALMGIIHSRNLGRFVEERKVLPLSMKEKRQLYDAGKGLVMKKNLSFYWKLFFSTFTISAFTIGGGYVIVPLMRKKFVEKLHWIEDQEMLDLIAIAQAAPGVMAVNASILVGYKISGIKGAFVTILGTVLPPLITITLIAYGYEAFSTNKLIRLLLMGMQAGAAAVIANVVINMTRDIINKKHWKPIAMMVLAFVASVVFQINVVIIILACGIIGAVDILLSKDSKEEIKS